MMRSLWQSWRWRPPVLAAAISVALASVALAQQAEPPAPPDRFETARLVWTTLIAVDQANQTGNYSVLRDLAAPGFRQVNDPARLAAIFAKVREQQLGLGQVVLATPVYAEPPKVMESGLYQVKGSFPGRPAGISFEMLFQYAEGGWRLFGIGVGALAAADPPDKAGAPPRPAQKPAAVKQ